jgi:hypothetical protein
MGGERIGRPARRAVRHRARFANHWRALGSFGWPSSWPSPLASMLATLWMAGSTPPFAAFWYSCSARLARASTTPNGRTGDQGAEGTASAAARALLPSAAATGAASRFAASSRAWAKEYCEKAWPCAASTSKCATPPSGFT